MTSVVFRQLPVKRLPKNPDSADPPEFFDNPLPTRGHSTDAGYDLTASEGVTVPGQILRESDTYGYIMVSTHIAMDIPQGYYGQIKSRSGLAAKHGIVVGAGTIDSGYHGEVKVLLRNTEASDFVVRPGDRIAQIVFHRHESPEVLEVSDFDQDTSRGVHGFGSTGVSLSSSA